MKCCGIGLSLCLVASAYAADISVVDEIVAKVNGDIVTRSELDKGYRQIEADLRRANETGEVLQKDLTEKSKGILADRIDSLLLISKGKELNINVDPEVSKYLANLRRESHIVDDDKFQVYVREQTGQPFEDFKLDVKNGLLRQRVIGQEVSSKINIPKADIRKYYDEHKSEFMREEQVGMREILIAVKDGKDPKQVAAALKKAQDLVVRARKGEKFPELAHDYSDAATKDQGGDIGFYKKGALNPKMEDIVFKAERGAVTDPIRVDNGYLILKIEEHYKAGQAAFDDVENEVMEKLYAPRMGPKVREYLTQLRQEAFLEIKPGYDDIYAAPGKDTKWQDPAQLKPETVTKEEVASRKHKKHLLGVPIPGTTKKIKQAN
jgi:peptidyl-prolyl cis-trans isomerase SurA